MHTHVHARARGWHGPTHVCAHAVSSGMSCTATLSEPALATQTNRSRCVLQKCWEWVLHGHGTCPSGHSFWTSAAWSHQVEKPTCALGSVSSWSAFSRWIFPKRKPVGAFCPWSWMETKAQCVGVILRHCQQCTLDPEKVTGTRTVLETSRYLPELIFRCVQNQMDYINLGNCILLEWHVRCLHAFLNFLLNLYNFCKKDFTMEVHLNDSTNFLNFLVLSDWMNSWEYMLSTGPPKSVNLKYNGGLT